MYSDWDDYAVLHEDKIASRIVKESFSTNEARWKWSFKSASGGYEEPDGRPAEGDGSIAALMGPGSLAIGVQEDEVRGELIQ